MHSNFPHYFIELLCTRGLAHVCEKFVFGFGFARSCLLEMQTFYASFSWPFRFCTNKGWNSLCRTFSVTLFCLCRYKLFYKSRALTVREKVRKKTNLQLFSIDAPKSDCMFFYMFLPFHREWKLLSAGFFFFKISQSDELAHVRLTFEALCMHDEMDSIFTGLLRS